MSEILRLYVRYQFEHPAAKLFCSMAESFGGLAIALLLAGPRFGWVGAIVGCATGVIVYVRFHPTLRGTP